MSATPPITPSPPPSQREPAGRFYIPALDGLRTVAFLMVWFLHTNPVPPPYGGPPSSLRAGFVQAGAYGVVVFFVLSAFLITRLLLTERERMGRIDIRAYYLRRTLRIWPLYFLMVALTVVYYGFKGWHEPGAIASLATFTANWYTATHHGMKGFSDVLWSVSVEEQFYLVWPFVLASLSARRLRTVCFGMIVAALVSRILTAHASHDWIAVWSSTLTHLDALGLGTLLALGYDRIPRLSRGAWYAAFIACFVVLGFQATLFPIVFRDAPYDVLAGVGYTLVPFVATVIVALALTSRGTFLENRWLVGLGRITFGTYCYHAFVLHIFHGGGALHFPLAFAATLTLAWVSYHAYEKRFLRLKHRFEKVSTTPAS